MLYLQPLNKYLKPFSIYKTQNRMLVDLKVTLNTLLWRIQKPTTMKDWQTKVQGDLSAETLYPSDAKDPGFLLVQYLRLRGWFLSVTKNLAQAALGQLNIPIMFILNYSHQGAQKTWQRPNRFCWIFLLYFYWIIFMMPPIRKHNS